MALLYVSLNIVCMFLSWVKAGFIWGFTKIKNVLITDGP